MKTSVFILFLTCIIMTDCKKPGNDAVSTTNSKKSPVKYLRFNGVDGLLMLSTETSNLTGITSGTMVDTFVTANVDKSYCYFPGSDGVSYNDAGNIYFDYHVIGENPDNSYLQFMDLDTCAFDTTSQFTSNWSVQGGTSIPGFYDNFTLNNFPSSFYFSNDTVIHKSTGYVINAMVRGGGSFLYADSIVYLITGLYSGAYVAKTQAFSSTTCVFSSGDLSVFSPGDVVSVEVIVYNYRHAVKGTQDIYFINQRMTTNMVLNIRS